MQDQPLSAWKSRVSLNTVISFMAVISRASIMAPIAACISQLKWTHFERPQNLYNMEVFDDASRSGLGALTFIRKLPLEVAAIGAWVSILAFVIGPFYQQLVDLQQRPVLTVNNQTAAAFGYSYAYDFPIYRAHGGSPDGIFLALHESLMCLRTNLSSTTIRCQDAGGHIRGDLFVDPHPGLQL
jgi:hypothetical protein